MIELRPARERGHASHGWLDSQHSFSFADYRDPAHMHWGALRVINEDRVAPGHGFPPHGHRDMEIISYVLSGALEHRDSMGNGTVIRPGDVQRMSAGQGVVHSEYNPSQTEPVHFLQIWIVPSVHGITPGYEQTHFSHNDRRGNLLLLASPDGESGSLHINQDALMFAGIPTAKKTLTHSISFRRLGYVQVARGSVLLNGQRLSAGDGAKLGGGLEVELAATEEEGEVLLFDLPSSQAH